MQEGLEGVCSLAGSVITLVGSGSLWQARRQHTVSPSCLLMWMPDVKGVRASLSAMESVHRWSAYVCCVRPRACSRDSPPPKLPPCFAGGVEHHCRRRDNGNLRPGPSRGGAMGTTAAVTMAVQIPA